MHVSGLNHSLALVMGGVAGGQDEAAKPAAKKPTAKEILEEEKRSGYQAREGTGLGDN